MKPPSRPPRKPISRLASSKRFLGFDDTPYVNESQDYLKIQAKTIAANRTFSVTAFSTQESDYDQSDDDEVPPCAETLDGIVFSLWFAMWFPVFVFATLWQSLTTFLPVVPAKVNEITNMSWMVGIAIWFGMLFIGFSLSFFQRNEGTVAVVLVPVLLAQFSTIIYLQMRPELSSRIPGHKKIHSTICCISVYSSVDWSSFFNYWEPIVPIVEYFQIVSVAIAADMAPYWDLASERSMFSYLLVIDVVVLNVFSLLSITIFYFIGIGVFIHYQIDQKSNFGYLIYEFIPGAMFLTVSATALDAVKNGREVERFAGYLTLALYSSTAIFVTIYRFHEKWFADIVYTPTWLALERITKQVFAIISVYAFGKPRLKLGLSIVVVISLIGTFLYLKPCSKPWLVYIRAIFMLSGLSFLFAGLTAVNHGETGGIVFLSIFQVVLGVILFIQIGVRYYQYVLEPPDQVAVEAVYNREIKATTGVAGRFQNKMKDDKKDFASTPKLDNYQFSEAQIDVGDADDMMALVVLTDLNKRGRSGSDPTALKAKSQKRPLTRTNSRSVPLPPAPQPLSPNGKRAPPPVPLSHRKPKSVPSVPAPTPPPMIPQRPGAPPTSPPRKALPPRPYNQGLKHSVRNYQAPGRPAPSRGPPPLPHQSHRVIIE